MKSSEYIDMYETMKKCFDQLPQGEYRLDNTFFLTITKNDNSNMVSIHRADKDSIEKIVIDVIFGKTRFTRDMPINNCGPNSFAVSNEFTDYFLFSNHEKRDFVKNIDYSDIESIEFQYSTELVDAEFFCFGNYLFDIPYGSVFVYMNNIRDSKSISTAYEGLKSVYTNFEEYNSGSIISIRIV